MFNQKFKKAVDRWAGYVPQVLLSFMWRKISNSNWKLQHEMSELLQEISTDDSAERTLYC